MKLFRFRSINEYLWQELELSEIYAGAPAGLNDPFDCQFDPIIALVRAIELAESHERLQFIKTILAEFKKRDPRAEGLGIACFTSNMESTVMWSHYADAHRGVCLMYEWPDSYLPDLYSSDENGPYFVGQAPVNYANSPFLDWLLEGNLNDPEPGEFVMNAATKTLDSKHSQWSYEEEFRIIMSEPCFLKLEPQFLKQVTFGLRTPDRQKVLVKSVVSKLSPNALFVQASHSNDDGFRLAFEDLE